MSVSDAVIRGGGDDGDVGLVGDVGDGQGVFVEGVAYLPARVLGIGSIIYETLRVVGVTVFACTPRVLRVVGVSHVDEVEAPTAHRCFVRNVFGLGSHPCDHHIVRARGTRHDVVRLSNR